MHPDPRELGFAGMRAALRDLVFVMRKDQVDAAGVDVEDVAAVSLADQVERHRRALEMPAGTAAAERRVPRGADRLVVGPRRLPEHEVAGVLLGVLVGCSPARPRRP